MWNGPHLSRIFVLPKAIAFLCFFLLLTVQTWAQIENETFEHAFGLHYWDNKESRESQFTESNENDVHASQEGILRPSFEGEDMLESENHDVDNHKEAIEKIVAVPPSKEDVPNDVKDDVTFSTDSDSPEADRYAPRPDDTVPNYVLTETRLKQIRSKFMYWFFDKGGANDEGDYQKEIQAPMPQVHKNFNFQLPFYGFIFNYTRVSMNGYLEFSDPPTHYTYPLVFPVKDWPKENDPSFIGIFFSKCRIGEIRPTDIDQRKPGVYFRLEQDLQRRTDQFGVEMRERLKWDIREGIIGAESFEPKHAVIVTWKNVSFSGGIDSSLYKTNTFQMVLATDEVNTYVIFNYLDIQWTSHTEAGGDTVTGEGGVPAFVGFNAGNGTQSYEYTPYSQRSTIRELTRRGWANGFPGRHMFKIDKKILPANCNKDIDED